MRKNKSKKSKVPVLDEKSYTAYLEYLRNEGNLPKTDDVKKQDLTQRRVQVGEEGQ